MRESRQERRRLGECVLADGHAKRTKCARMRGLLAARKLDIRARDLCLQQIRKCSGAHRAAVFDEEHVQRKTAFRFIENDVARGAARDL